MDSLTKYFLFFACILCSFITIKCIIVNVKTNKLVALEIMAAVLTASLWVLWYFVITTLK